MSKPNYLQLFGCSMFFWAALAGAETGVTAKTITLGQSAALSGPAQELGQGMRDGAQAYFDMVNAQGGVAGRQITLKTLDDGYEAERAASNTRALSGKDGVFALFGYVGTATSNAALPLVRKEGIPFFAPYTGAQSLREPLDHYIFHVRASYAQEMDRIVEHATTLAMSKIAVLYQNDAYGQAGLESIQRALAKRNIAVLGVATVERNSSEVKAAVAALRRLQPQAVVMVSAYTSSAAFIKEMHKGGGTMPVFWNISFVGSEALVHELGADARGIMISQVMPAPWDDINPVIKEYHQWYVGKHGHTASYVSVEGFIAAKVLVEGLRRTGANLTREGLIRALEGMGTYHTGGFDVKFSSQSHNGSDFIDLTVVGRDGRFMH
ncbi:MULTISPECIES: ABC transporter substrate-binding protein [unclassified Undibacterium]|uniref:ABC transporter substrate-binding protein n=1 Tax=unclassified Undibacterium TaxID=2630295 RepID=UPI002AC9E731|nr:MULTISPECIES: ABC transporter substrate-binding protein [unclassified Undibacterium]MEB0140996.1 ABC transporter substrate-binding protein [Undibacterium sp. CCC2.1]MEB0173998.1 ABC transporter substrate-binding protein [Undibacterium sp. CCC1.1]MEB0177920.1 ABC transporter substrate-binding protein [Undibacterium sp. CCC3.4]MEB0217196.1 ABC transporter substrate-binding protein [Undibacterium sp. 5I2]WPX42172.1 ABC transporter substrate-binding protein [Undibacterium sp. CCC3.4]